MMITVILLTFMTAGLLIFTTMVQRMHAEYGVSIKLSNEGRATMDKMVWGGRVAGQPDRFGIWEATDVQLVSPTEISYTDPNGIQHGIRLNGLRVETRYDIGAWTPILDPNGAAPDDPGSNALTLNFTEPQPNIVEIQLVLGQRVTGRWQYASLATKVNVRNA